jgi:hypothetical protein
MNEEPSFKDLENPTVHRVSKLCYMVDTEYFISLIAPFAEEMTFPVDDHLRR